MNDLYPIEPPRPKGPLPAIFGEELSPRERQCIDLLAKGLANKEIARKLGIGPGSVKTHIYRAYKKLGVTKRVQAARHGR